MSFSVSQVDDILNPHTPYSRYVALPSAYSQLRPMWEMELFLCLYNDACVLRMSLLYSAFEVRSDSM